MRLRRTTSAAAVLALAGGALLAVPLPSAVAAGPVSVTTLETEATATPLGIDDPRPTLSWNLASEQRGVLQRSFQVTVATSAARAARGAGDVWTSPRTTSRAMQVDYAGPALDPRTRYWWSVRVWAPGVTDWSTPSWFETAYLDEDEWRGSWISGPPRPTANLTVAEGRADDSCCLQPSTTLDQPAAAGDRVLRVEGVGAFTGGQTITVGTGATSETATVASVGTPAVDATVVGPVAAGATRLALPATGQARVPGPAGANVGFLDLAVGAPLTIGTGAATQTVTITSVGTPVGAATTAFAPADAGATTVRVAGVNGFVVGEQALVGGEVRTVSAVGTQGRATTVARAAAAGATTLLVANAAGLVPGDVLTLGTGATASTAVVDAVGTQITLGTYVTLRSGLTAPVAAATAVRTPGTGITLTAPLTAALAQGAAVRGLGSGVQVTPAITGTHAAGTAVSTPGSGIALAAPLTRGHAAGATVVGPAPQDACRPVGSSQNAGQCKPIRPSILLRKAFDVAPVSQHGAVVAARVYSSGLGWNEMTLNGRKTLPKGHFNPGFTEYNDTVQYTVEDVTELVSQDATRPTANVIASELGAGRYDSETRPSNHGFEFAQWRDVETLKADLYVTYADGTEQLVRSDDSWRASIAGPTRYNDFDDGETFDARKQLPGWDTPTFDAGGWQAARTVDGPTGELVRQKHEVTEIVAERTGPFTRETVAPGIHVYDIGRQTVGRATQGFWGTQPGDVIRVTYVERRDDDPARPGPQDGTLQLPTGFGVGGQYLQQQYYVSDGTGTAEEPELFAPKFNFSGFQWVQITGSGGAPLPERIQTSVQSVQEIRTHFPETGTFESSSPLLNEIHAITKNSIAMNNVAGYSMDTPTYEKDGWTGDTQLIAPTAALMFDTQRQWKKSARDIVDSQWKDDEVPGAEGAVSMLIPGAVGYGYCSPVEGDPYACGNSPSVNVFKTYGNGATPIWDAMIAVVPWEAYQRYGDVEPLETAYPTMRTYLTEFIPKWFQADGDGYDFTLSTHLGDWGSPTGADAPRSLAEGEKTRFNLPRNIHLGATAYTAHIAQITADTARVLGRTAEAAEMDALYEDIKADFNAKYWNPSLGYYHESPGDTVLSSTACDRCPEDPVFTQTANSLALAFGFVPQQHRRALQEKLVHDVLVTRDGHQFTGIAGNRWIWPMLSQAAREGVPDAARAAYTIATQTTYPSYGYWSQALGFTGLGEYWEASTRTRNHQMHGEIGQWMYEELAGITSLEPGYRKIAIKPLISEEPDAQLNRVRATYRSVAGPITSAWSHTEAGVTMDVTIPAGTTAVVHVPAAHAGAVNEVGTGRSLDADKAPGVRLVGQEGGAVVFEIGSGSYSFRVTDPVSLDALTDRFEQLVTTGAVPGSVAAGLRDRLVRAEARAAAGDEAAAADLLRQFDARVRGSVRAAAARDELLALSRDVVDALRANDEREDAPPTAPAS